MNLNSALLPGGPVVQVLVAGDDDVTDWLHAQEQSRSPRIFARAIRGSKSATEEAFFNELAAAWQLPHYFGENWDAVTDSVGDPFGRPADARTYVLVVRHADNLLDREPPARLKTFSKVMLQAADRLATPMAPDAPVSLRVLLQVSKNEEVAFRRRLRDAGITDVPAK
jgi:hypothetical protein